MARNQWQDWMLSPFYPAFIRSQPPYPSGSLCENIITHLSLDTSERILVAGCGFGGLTAEIAAKGFDVTGIDYAGSLIDVANESEQLNLTTHPRVAATTTDASASESLQFYQHDLRLPFWSNYFSLAFNTVRSFGSYDTKREHDNVLRTIAGSLVPGGHLLIEYINAGYKGRQTFASEQHQAGSTAFGIAHSQDATYFYSTITVTDPTLAEPEVFVYKKEKFSLADFTSMLNLQGLHVQHVFGNDDLTVYDAAASPKLIIVAVKSSAEKGDGEKRLYSDGRTGDALT